MNDKDFILSEEEKNKILDEIRKFEVFRESFIRGILFFGNMFNMMAEDLGDIRNKLICNHLDSLTIHQREMAIDILNGKMKPVRRAVFLSAFTIIWIVVIFASFVHFL